MKIVIASDSYKGSLSSFDVAKAIQEGINEKIKDVTYDVFEMADGGEGTVDAVLSKVNGRKIKLTVHNPLQQHIQTEYGLLNDTSAIMEMASASGLTLVDEKNPLIANTIGTGEMIVHAIEQGIKTIYIGIGGSATNDGGIGMAYALGYRFLDCHHQEVEPLPCRIHDICRIDTQNVHPLLKECTIKVMCDVNNPLCGNKGASFIYGPQKGANEQDVLFLDQQLNHLSKVIHTQFNKDYSNIPGAGAAGGLGFGLLTFTNASLHSGIDMILEMTHFQDAIADATLIITGEGRMDNQSLYGKVPYGVAMNAKEANLPIFAIVGSLGDDIDEISRYFSHIEPCVTPPFDLDDAILHAYQNVKKASQRLLAYF